MRSVYYAAQTDEVALEEPEDKPGVTMVVPPPAIPHFPLS